MVKKRPSKAQTRKQNSRPAGSKAQPRYWRHRLFRNTFTHRGKRFEINHWSVKIQHRGTRKTFSFRGRDRARAAREACQLYQSILEHGWHNLNASHRDKEMAAQARRESSTLGPLYGLNPQYWAQRLVHRKYTETLHPAAGQELSVCMEYAGLSHYFPLGTADRKEAAVRAVRIFQTIAHDGWTSACQRFARELSVAFRWADSPVAWTYTTIHTHPNGSPALRALSSRPSTGKLGVAIIETDSGIRRALAWCINQQEGCHCAVTCASAEEGLREIPRWPIHLLLINQNLIENPGTPLLERLNRSCPKIAGLVFSVYEDCDQLFKCAPGGAPSYLFRRTPATRILEPITEAVVKQTGSLEQIASEVRVYFERTVSALPILGGAYGGISLTQREQQILALLSKGQPDKEIADLLRISTWTVHGHLKKIFEKLRVHNRTAAVLKYLHK